MSNMINRNGQRMPSSQDHRHRMMYRSNASPSPQSSRLPATPVMNRALPQYQRPDMQPLVNFSPSHQYYQPANVQPVINTYRRRSPQYQTHRPANMPIMAHENRRSPPRFGRPIQPMANENHPPLAQFGRLVNMPSNRLPIEIAQNLQSVRLPAEHDLLENCYKYLSGLTPEPVYGSEAFDGALKQFAQTANPIEHEHVYTIV